MKLLVKIFVIVEKVILCFSYLLMTIMTAIVFIQVILRYFFNSGIPWVEEVATLCIVWYGFISIAFGIIGKDHIAIESFTRWVPEKIRNVWDRINYMFIGLYGLFMVIYGTKLTKLVAKQTLPATKWTYSIVYASVPFAGVLFMIFGFLVLLGVPGEYPELNYKNEEQSK